MDGRTRGADGRRRTPRVEHFMTDSDVARLLKVSASTVRRIARQGPARAGAFDLRLCEPVIVGGMRRWPAAKVYAVLGIGRPPAATA